MISLGQDFRFALRKLQRSPVFTLVAILTLALGIGSTTAIFSIVDGVLLKPLPYRDSGRLVVVWERARLIEKVFPYSGPNPRHAAIWQQQNKAFSELTILQQGTAGVALGTDHPTYVGRLIAQPNLLPMLGVQPALGRNFVAADATKSETTVVLITWHLWQTLFNADPNVIGRTLRISGSPSQVIGVLPRDFYFPKSNELSSTAVAGLRPDAEIITPLFLDLAHNFGWNSDYGNYDVLGRLNPGYTVATAQAELDGVSNDIVRQFPPGELDGPPAGELSTYVQPLKEVVVGKTSSSLWLLFAAVVSVLFIACINLANAQLARFIARDREAALRSALGASAWELVRSSLAEVFLLCAAGGALGVLIANETVDSVVAFVRLAIPRTASVSVDGRVLALAIALTFCATLFFGALPALRFSRIAPQQALQGAGRAAGSRSGNLLRRWLIGAQVFACTTLLLVTALFARSLNHLLTADKGFASEHIVVASVGLQGASFVADPERARFDDAALERLHQLPGVQSATMVSALLLQGQSWIDGVSRPDRPAKTTPLANYRWISPDYFATLEQRIIEGRPLDAHDRDLKNAVISEATAKSVWPEGNALGRQFTRNGVLFTVVGVVADTRSNSLREAPVSTVYLPYGDNPPYRAFFLVRSTQDTASLAGSVQKAIWSASPDATIASVRSLDSQVADSLAPERIDTLLLAAFGTAAFLLALLGIYGTLSYSVESRTREIGIRMALGATRERVYGVIFNETVPPVLFGLVFGYGASIIIGRTLRALLFESSAIDLSVAVSVIAVFLLAVGAATFLPCRRAASINPVDALKAE